MRLSARALPLILAAGAFAVAFAQRPGHTFADSRVELSADPALFLDRITALWSSTTDLGHVQSGQFVGYLFPMGPWFALAHAIGLPMWIAERLWMGSLLALSAWGAVVLIDDLYGRRRGIAHIVAAVVFAANPYVVTFGSRATVALLAYVAMPWLMVAAHRGLRETPRWRWPMAFGFALAAGGGGVNAAFLPWVLAAPALLLLYEVFALGARPGDVLAFVWRAGLCALVVSLWWIVPVALQAIYGGSFLSFLEQPAAIWSTTSMSESLRLLGYWVFYFGTGYYGAAEPSVSVASPYLFSPAVIIATFAVPLFAALGLLWNRGWRYAPMFAVLALVGVLGMSAGFPLAKPLERLMSDVYYDFTWLQFLRTTYKAAPDVALGFACLAGAAVASLYASARAGLLRVLGFRISRWFLLPLVAVPICYALPFFDGTAIDARLEYTIPAYWRAAIADADRTTPPDRRIMVLPGQLFSWYRWGETIASIAPSISRRPVLIRQATQYADARSSELLAAVDDLVQQARLVPGQLRPLLDLMAVGQVLVPADGLGAQSGEPDPATAARALDHTLPPARPTKKYGRSRAYVPQPGRGGSPVPLPDIRRYRLSPPAPGIVRAEPTRGATVLDGDAGGITSLAAVGDLDIARPLFYAGDLPDRLLRDQVRGGATLVFTDSDRRGFTSGARTTANTSETLGPTDPIPPGLASYNLFPARGSPDQTVALYSGLRSLRTPLFEGLGLMPQYRPYAAFDGRLDTTWLATMPDPKSRYIDLRFARARRVAAIDVHTHADIFGGTLGLATSVNGASERRHVLQVGWTRVPIDSSNVRTLRLRVTGTALGAGLGGFDEVRIPGLRVRESLRLPSRLARQTRGMDLSHNAISVVLKRTTADFPYRAGAEVEAAQAGNPLDAVDAESGMERTVTLPVGRSFGLDGWASVDPAAADTSLDRLVGMPRGWAFYSSSRFEGLPIYRASSAFDGDRATAWVGNFLKQQFAWIAFRAPHPIRIRRFRLIPLSSAYAFPTLIQVRTPGGYRRQVRVGRDGTVVLPKAIRTSFLRINLLSLRAPFGPRALRAVAISDVHIPGLEPPRPRRHGRFLTRCGEITVASAGARATAAASGTVAQLDSGAPLALRGCGADRILSMNAGTTRLSVRPGATVRPDHLRLRSSAPGIGPPATGPVAPSPPPAILSAGTGSNGRRDGVRVDTHGPAWLVLGESYSRGWEAWCKSADGTERSLGQPVPINGYASGWRVGPQCRTARFAFTPQRLATASYWLSALGVVVMLMLLAGGIVLRRRGLHVPRSPFQRDRAVNAAHPVPLPSWTVPPLDPVRRVGWLGALAAAAIAGAIGGYVFAVRAGVVIAPVVFALLRLGVSARRLLAVTLLGIAALPIVYVASPSPNAGGFYFYYSLHHIDAHWIAVGAVCALCAASAIMVWDVAAGSTSAPASSGRLSRALAALDLRDLRRRRRPKQPAAGGRR
jgi:arabinofuranan 3-O-arabinosyltransferase